jgi:hypothetical protein
MLRIDKKGRVAIKTEITSNSNRMGTLVTASRGFKPISNAWLSLNIVKSDLSVGRQGSALSGAQLRLITLASGLTCEQR